MISKVTTRLLTRRATFVVGVAPVNSTVTLPQVKFPAHRFFDSNSAILDISALMLVALAALVIARNVRRRSAGAPAPLFVPPAPLQSSGVTAYWISTDQAARLCDRHLRNVLNSLTAFVCVLTPEGILIEMNLAAVTAAGIKVEDMLGKPFEQTYWWSHSPLEQARIRDAIAKGARGEASRYDVLARLSKDRPVIFDFMLAPMFDENGDVTHLVPSAIDVTDQRWAEKSLRESERRLNLAMQAAGLGTWDADMRTGITQWSEQHFSLLGYDSPGAGGGEATMQMWRDRVHPDDAQRVEQALQAAQLDGSPFKPQYRIIRADNSRVVWLSVNGRFLLEGDHRTRFIGVVQDITEWRRAEDLAKHQHDELAHMSRLVTMGEMASGLAHELNQPLGAILNYAVACSAILESAANPEENTKAIALLSDLERETARAGDIINRMRSFIRKRAPNRLPTEVPDLVRYAVNLMASEMRLQSMSMQLALPAEMPKVMADPIQIGQVLVNLIRNAMDAMGDVEQEKRRIIIGAAVEKNGAVVRVSVTDMGPGIPKAQEDHIFESFFTTKSSGLGVGLTISRSIVESHGGHLGCAGNPGGGAVFSFTLPSVDPNANTEPRNAA